jgi:hypothetical protein
VKVQLVHAGSETLSWGDVCSEEASAPSRSALAMDPGWTADEKVKEEGLTNYVSGGAKD